MSQQYTAFERIQLLQKEIAIWEQRDPGYTDELYEELKTLVEEANEEYEVWSEHAVEGIDYDIIVLDPNQEKKKEAAEPIVKEPANDFQSNEFYRKIDEIHKALFSNPNKTKEQKEEEMIELMKARKIMQGVKKRNRE